MASSIRPQPLISVADVQASSRWYQAALGATSDHGGPEYERLVVDGALVLQLHRIEVGHHHGTIGDPEHRELWVRDPDGYLVVVAEPVTT